MNVVVLAGGQATRLKGLWNKSKFFVPVGGRALIDRLMLDFIAPLKPERVVFAVDHNGAEIEKWCSQQEHPIFHHVEYSMEMQPAGTAGAFRAAAMFLSGPTMVLNHDTIPFYDLRALANFHETLLHSHTTIASVWSPGRSTYAGTAVLSAKAVVEACVDERMRDFPAYLLGAHQYNVPGFLDVGTPEGFEQAQKWSSK